MSKLVAEVKAFLAKAPAVAKFIVAAVGIAVSVGVLSDHSAQLVVGVLTALGVYAVPNA